MAEVETLPPKADPDSELTDKDGVAEMLLVSRRTVDNLMAEGRLPFIKLTPKIVRFRKSDVRHYLDTHTVRARSRF